MARNPTVTKAKNGKARQTKPLDAERKARAARAVELRAQGWELQAIADELGVSLTTAWRDVRTGFDLLDDATAATAEKLRKREAAALDELEAKLVRAIEKIDEAEPGELLAKMADRLLKVQARRAALFGLDAPKGLDLSSSSGDVVFRVEIPAPRVGPYGEQAGEGSGDDE